MSDDRPGAVPHALIVALSAVIAFENSLLNGFALDDVPIIAQNPRVHQFADQAAIWLTPYWPQAGEQLGLYRPLTIFGYALQWAAGEGAPWLFHGVNILLHACAALLVLFLLRTLARPGAALAGAVIFAVHPVHAEAVANVVGQAELLAAIAVLGACTIHARRDQTEPSGLSTIFALGLLYAMGLLAKESAVVLPGLLVAVDAGQRRIGRSWGDIKRYVAANARLGAVLFTTLLAYFSLRIHVLGSFGGANAAPAFEYLRGTGRLLAAMRVWPEYARLLLFPVDLSADYSPAVIPPPAGTSPLVIVGAGILGVTIALAAATWRHPRRGLPFAWFLVAVATAAHIVIPIGVMLAERTLYLPSVGLAMGVAFVTAHLAARFDVRARRLAIAALALVVFGLAGRTLDRNRDWRSTDSIWAATLESHPESYKAQWWRSLAWYERGDIVTARDDLQVANNTWPYDYDLLTNLAGVHVELGEFDQAMAAIVDARTYGSVNPRTELIAAYLHLLERRYEEAFAAAEYAARLGSLPTASLGLQAQALDGLGRHDEAVVAWRGAIDTSIGTGAPWDYWIRMARSLALSDNAAEALSAANSAVARAPDDFRHVADSGRSAVLTGCWSPPRSAPSGIPATQDPCVPELSDPATVFGVAAHRQPLEK